MSRRGRLILGSGLLLLIAGAIALLATSEVTQTGSVSGLNYSITAGGLQNTSFASLPGGFQYVSTNWIGASKFEVLCSTGKLSINGHPAGTVVPGDTVTLTAGRQVLVNGQLRF